MTEIRTTRIRLRQFNDRDFDAYARFFTTPGSKYFGGPKDADGAWRHMAMMLGHWQLNGFGHWAAEEIETGDFIGSVGFLKTPSFPEMELGYWIDDRKLRKGYATEAAAACRDHGRDVMGLPRLVSFISPDNLGSQNVARSLGATHEKTIELGDQGPHMVYRHF